MAVYSPVTAFLLLISSALVLDTAIYFRRHEKIFDHSYDYEKICDMEKCGNVEAAGVSPGLEKFQILLCNTHNYVS